MSVTEFSREEYVDFVTRRRGSKGLRHRMHAATPDEIRAEWDNVKEDHDCYKNDPLVKENNMSYETWWHEINIPTKYEPIWEQEKKEMWDEEMAKYKKEVAND